MAALIGLFVGAILGKLAFGETAAALLAIVGFVVGALLTRRGDRDRYRKPTDASRVAATTVATTDPHALAERVAALERRVAELERGAGAAHADAAVATPPTAFSAPSPAFETVAPATGASGVPAAREAAAAPDADRAIEAVPPLGAPATHAANAIRAWIVGGNPLARVGALVLLIGVGFLLKYAAEHVTVPIELRLAAVALGGVALLGVGWKLRERRTGYAMIVQGAGIGVLYLTVFAAMRLYALIPPPAAFTLLVWICVLSSWLAVRQDAIALATLGVLGGFAAPILTSTSSGSHVMLFSYYALLNAGILFVAWFKAWRPLNLLGFVCTFVVGTLWGVTRYRPELFATTEPFLVLFFVFYVAIAVLYASRRSVEVASYVDGTIVFGTPLAAAALQHALVRDIDYAMAASAIAAAAIYVGLAKWLYARRRDDLRLLVESFVALGCAFATLAVPFALDARWTSGTWALEGAAVAWVGARQRRAGPRWFGLALQLVAGVAFAWGVANEGVARALPVLNSDFVGAALIALAALVTAYVYRAHDDAIGPAERALVPIVFAWGLAWWLGGVWREIERFVPAVDRMSAGVAFLAADAALFAALASRLRWPIARVPVALTLPALLAIAAGGVAMIENFGSADDHLFAHAGKLAWPFAIAVTVLLLRRYEGDDEPRDALDWAHAAALWLATIVASHELGWLADAAIAGSGVWRIAAWGVAPAAIVTAVAAASSTERWPLGAHRRGYVVEGAGAIVACLALWSLAANVSSDGDPSPLPFVPLVNPLDLAQGFVLVAALMWSLRLRALAPDAYAAVPRGVRLGVPALVLFVWANALALRTVHHATGIAYDFDALWGSTLVQAVLSLLWTVCALATMVASNRRAQRAGWIAGAALLAVVVAKLFVVDLSRVGTIERIVSFIGVGLLLLLIGYVAPVPARKESP